MEHIETVNTDENAEQNFKFAGFGRRLAASMIDGFILFLFNVLFDIVLSGSMYRILTAETIDNLQRVSGSSGYSKLGLLSSVIQVILIIVVWVNFDGATPGKKLMGIKIIKTDGTKLTYGTAIVRYIGYIVSSLVLMLGFLWAIWDKKKQAWHDKLAKTYVVETGKKPRIAVVIFLIFAMFISVIVFSGVFFLKGVQLAIKDSKLKSQKQEQLLSPKAQGYYDKTQELFAEIRTVGNDVNAIIPVADELIAQALLAVEESPKSAKLWANLGDAYTWPNTKSKDEDALEAYMKAEELEPNDSRYIDGVADQLIRMGRYDDAVLRLKKSLRIKENSGYAHWRLGRAYRGLGIKNDASSEFNEAISIYESVNSDGMFDDSILEIKKELTAL